MLIERRLNLATLKLPMSTQQSVYTLKGCSNYTDDIFLNILKSLEGSDLKFSVHKLESVFNTLSTSKNLDDQRLSKYFRIMKVGVKIENL